jgi:hypothetical protein
MERDLEDAVADAFIDKMLEGSFPHLNAYVEREEGKVPDRVQMSGDIKVALEGKLEEWSN